MAEQHYEARHREMRTASSAPGRWETSDVDGCRIQDIGRGNMVAYAESNEASRTKSRADAALIAFEHNAGPLVDDLVAAVRELQARYLSGCINPIVVVDDPDAGEKRCDRCVACRLVNRLAALDEASR